MILVPERAFQEAHRQRFSVLDLDFCLPRRERR
jgi:hypothetical protein